MNFREAIKQIESYEFSARLNIASDFNTFLKMAQQEIAVKILLKELDNGEKRLYILSHIFELAREKLDLRYENKWDTALAVYIWLLNLKSLKLARIAAEAIIEITQCWWANKMAQQICYEKITYAYGSKPATATISVSSPYPLVSNVPNEAEEALLIASLISEADKMGELKIVNSTNDNDKSKYKVNFIHSYPMEPNFNNTNCALI